MWAYDTMDTLVSAVVAWFDLCRMNPVSQQQVLVASLKAEALKVLLTNYRRPNKQNTDVPPLQRALNTERL